MIGLSWPTVCDAGQHSASIGSTCNGCWDPRLHTSPITSTRARCRQHGSPGPALAHNCANILCWLASQQTPHIHPVYLYIAKLNNLDFHLLEVVSRYRDPQLLFCVACFSLITQLRNFHSIVMKFDKHYLLVSRQLTWRCQEKILCSLKVKAFDM